MRIAWFTPFRRGGSGIANYSGAACDALLADGHEVVAFAPDLRDPRMGIRTDMPIVGLEDGDHAEVLRTLPNYDLVVYNLGDNIDYHKTIYEISRAHPGIVVLHDLVMRDFFCGYFLRERGGDLPGLLRLMAFCHGAEGAAWMEALTSGRIPDVWFDPYVLEYHMARAAVAAARGVVVHSEFCRSRVADLAGVPVARIDFPIHSQGESALRWDPPRIDAAGRPVRILTFGHINKNKCVHLVIEAIGSSPVLRDGVVYTVLGEIGDPDYHGSLRSLIERHGLDHAVRLVGSQPDEAFLEQLREADLVVNLRAPHFGESSWSLLEALFAAKPTIVWDHGSYSELPSWAVRKVCSSQELTSTMESLSLDPELRHSLGGQARRYAVQTFAAERYRRGLLEFADSVRRWRAALDLTDRLAHLIREMDAGPDALTLMERVADELDLLTESGGDQTDAIAVCRLTGTLGIIEVDPIG